MRVRPNPRYKEFVPRLQPFWLPHRVLASGDLTPGLIEPGFNLIGQVN